MATKKKAAPAPAEAEAEEVKRVPAGQFLLDSGLLFEINRTVLHPLGYDLFYSVEDDRFHVAGGDMAEDTVTMKYTPAAFAEGRAKYLQMMNAWGYLKQQERKKRLGYIVQER